MIDAEAGSAGAGAGQGKGGVYNPQNEPSFGGFDDRPANQNSRQGIQTDNLKMAQDKVSKTTEMM